MAHKSGHDCFNPYFSDDDSDFKADCRFDTCCRTSGIEKIEIVAESSGN